MPNKPISIKEAVDAALQSRDTMWRIDEMLARNELTWSDLVSQVDKESIKSILKRCDPLKFCALKVEDACPTMAEILEDSNAEKIDKIGIIHEYLSENYVEFDYRGGWEEWVWIIRCSNEPLERKQHLENLLEESWASKI